MLVEQFSDLAGRVLAGIRGRTPIPVQKARVPGPRPAFPALTPEVDVKPNRSTVSVVTRVPGATPENVLVFWDEEISCLCVRVDRAGTAAATHDWYEEIPLPVTVDGAKSVCTLDNDMLRVRAPLEDTPASTGLTL